MNWTIEYDNDTGPGDEGYWEWWNVCYKGVSIAEVDDDKQAEWLCKVLNDAKAVPPGES